MNKKSQEKGQALIMIALAAVGLFAFSALAIDGSMVFSDKRHAQNAADTAVLAAALGKLRAENNPDAAAVTAGLARAASNGYANDSDSTVEVHFCNEIGITCEGLPATVDTDEEKSEYIQVKITSIVHTTFARILGRQTLTNIVTAVARAKVGGLNPLYEGSALVALAPTGTDTIGGNGNIFLDIKDSGVFDNSRDNCGMGVVGNGHYEVDTAFSVAGTFCQNGNNTVIGPIQSASQVPYPPTLDIPTPSITCSGNGSVSGSTVSPGNFSSLNPLNLINGSYTFLPGSYCINGDVTINGNIHITANNVDILITSGDFQINGNSTFDCDSALIHISGGSGMHFNGNGSNTCTNVTFFASTGSVSWNGNVANTFTAPASTSGSHPEYANLLIYMPHPNPSPLSINGNAGNELTGSIIAVSSPITISGNSGTTGLHSSITGYTITLAGNSNTTINYVPEEQFNQLDPSAILLIK